MKLIVLQVRRSSIKQNVVDSLIITHTPNSGNDEMVSGKTNEPSAMILKHYLSFLKIRFVEKY